MERSTGKVGVATVAASQAGGVSIGAAAGQSVRPSVREGAKAALANRSTERAATLEERSGMPTLLLPRADGAIGRGGCNHAEAF
jgi:hypothetical protein